MQNADTRGNRIHRPRREHREPQPRVLMHGLIVCAKRRGFERLSGTILRVNEPMLAFVRALGFELRDDLEDSAQVVATLQLT